LTDEHAVVIAGAGPTGMMLAAELALAKVDVAIVERRTTQDLDGSRARGMHARTIEVLDQRGVADRFLSRGQTAQIGSFAGVRLDISDFPTRHNYGLALGAGAVRGDPGGLGRGAGGADVSRTRGHWVRAERCRRRRLRGCHPVIDGLSWTVGSSSGRSRDDPAINGG